jgi:adenylylsulfate kinase
MKEINKTYNQRGVVVWFTGLPSSGKTSISGELKSRLSQRSILACTLDGDEIRKGLSSDLGFSMEDRKENVRRIAEVAKNFVDMNIIVCVAVISPSEKGRSIVKNIFNPGQFIEVYLECPIEECERRDIKGNYKQARSGKILNFTGLSSPYEPPLNPEIKLNTHIQSIDECTDIVINFLGKFKYILTEGK